MDSRHFRGRFDMKVDGKGRLSLPAHWRGLLQESSSLIFASSQYQNQPCLDLYLPSGWKSLENKIERLSNLKPQVQAFRRFYLSSGQEVEADAQGRWLIPKSLRSHAQIDSEIVLVGMGNKIELWNQQIWTKVHAALAGTFEETLAWIADVAGEDGDE